MEVFRDNFLEMFLLKIKFVKKKAEVNCRLVKSKDVFHTVLGRRSYQNSYLYPYLVLVLGMKCL